jgi:hypothetical protein
VASPTAMTTDVAERERDGERLPQDAAILLTPLLRNATGVVR